MSMFTEVKRHKPSVVYIPNIETWVATLGGAALTTLSTMLKTIPPTDPILLLGTANIELEQVDREVLRELFGYSRKNRTEIARPDAVSYTRRRYSFRNQVNLISI